MSDQTNNFPDLDQETMDLFVEESTEGLQRVESMLLEAERGNASPNMMATLFRDIHTIKGTSGYFGLPKVMKLAHAAEDLLVKLRDKTITFTPAHSARLLQVVDALRAMIEHFREGAGEGSTEVEALIASIRNDLDPKPQPLPSKKPQVEGPAGSTAAAPGPTSLSQLPRLGEILLSQRAITAEQLDHALKTQEEVRASTPPPDHVDSTVRVNVAVLDKLMNLMGELVLARNQMVQVTKSNRENSLTAQAACQRLSLVTSDLQEQIMKTRMQPVSRVFEKIPRMVRDLCRTTGKQATCHIDGTSTEIDKALVEAIRDPLLHIVRNSVDHGLETPSARAAAGKPPSGKISVKASHEGGMVTIDISDDGGGMDPAKLRDHAVRKGLLSINEADRLTDREAIELIFRPGFSTAKAISDISGRGVGMDVVRNHIERVGGQVELESVVGQGTLIRLKMPLTLAIIPALLVNAREQRFAIPQVNLDELVYLNEEQVKTAIESVRGAPVYRLRGEILPLVRLGHVLELQPAGVPSGLGLNIIVVTSAGYRYGLLVDEIHDIEEIVIKPLHGALKRLNLYAGATVLGDGGVALILEMAGIAARAGIDVSTRRKEPSSSDEHAWGSGPHTFLVFRAGDGQQCAVPLAAVSRLEQVDRSAIERVAGREVLQYRKFIMPVLRPEEVLPLGAGQPSELQQLIVFDFGQPVGMAVHSIVDIVDVVYEDDMARAPEYTIGSMVVFGKTTLLLDVYAIARKLAPRFAQEVTQGKKRKPCILLADDSTAMRAAIGGYLRSAGLDVIEAPSGESALQKLRSAKAGSVDAVVTDLEMEGMGGFGVIESCKREMPALPVLVWTHREDPGLKERVCAAGAMACVSKLHREELVSALLRAGVGVRSTLGEVAKVA